MTDKQMQYVYWQRMRQQQLYRTYAAGYAKNETPSEPQTTGGYWEATVGSDTDVLQWSEADGYWIKRASTYTALIKYADGCWKFYEIINDEQYEFSSSETSKSAKRFICTYDNIQVICVWHE